MFQRYGRICNICITGILHNIFTMSFHSHLNRESIISLKHELKRECFCTVSDQPRIQGWREAGVAGETEKKYLETDEWAQKVKARLIQRVHNQQAAVIETKIQLSRRCQDGPEVRYLIHFACHRS